MHFLFIAACLYFINLDTSIQQGKDFLKRGEYLKAIEEFKQALPEHPELCKYIGIAYHKKGDYEKALDWWNKAVEINPEDEEVITGRWETMMEIGEKIEVEKEVKEYLEKGEDRRFALSVAYKGFSILEDTLPVKAIKDSITLAYPESKMGYDLIGEEFYDGLYPIWRNDTLKVEFLKAFLKKHPLTEWRSDAYKWMLSSLYRLKKFDELRETGERWLLEDSLNPFAYNYLAHLYLDPDRYYLSHRDEAGIDTDKALLYSKKAIDLEPFYKKPENKPIEQWELEKPPLYGNSRMVYAKALVAKGRYENALRVMENAIDNTKLGVDQNQTYGSYYYLLGDILEKMESVEEAMKAYIQALVCGDVYNRYSPISDSAFRRCYKKIFGNEDGIMDYARRFMGYGGVCFTDVTEEIGLGDCGASRIAWGDYNNDRYDDLLLNGRRLFKNLEGRRFVEVTEKAGLGDTKARGGVWADYDNDGRLDFFAIGKEDRLLHNNGDGTFSDVTLKAGDISDTFPTEGAAWGDYDRDGFVDLYIANYENWELHKYYPDRLLHNNGDGTFSDVTEEAGIKFAKNLAGRGVNWGDYDNDGDLDIYVSNYRLCENFLWRNNGDGTFTNVTHSKEVAGEEREGWWGHTIGSEWGDYDNDGDLDLITANLAHPRYIHFSNKTMLYESSGLPEFEFVDRRKEAGIKYEETHSDPGFGDVDKDGDLDLYITSVYEGRRSFLYENLGEGKFRDITWLSGTRVFNGWGCGFSDYDRDGDIDLFVGSGSGCRLFRNEGNQNNWLGVKAGIGARIKVRQGDKIQIREIEGGKGTTSQHSLTAFFGFGKDSSKIDIEVRFPSGTVKQIKGVKSCRFITIDEE